MVKVGRDCRTYSVQASVGGKTKGPVAIGRFEDGVLTENARRAAQQIIHAWRDGDAATAERIVEACRRGEEITTATLARPAMVDAPPALGVTLKGAFDFYMAQPGSKGGRKIKRRDSTIKDYTDVLNVHTPAEWWALPLASLTYAAVDAQHTRIGDNAGKATADKWCRYVRAVYECYDRKNPAVNLPKNPVKAVDFFRPPPRTDVIETKDLPDWWKKTEACSPIRRDCRRFLLLTGLRSNAGSMVKWDEIDLENGIITVPAERMKGGKALTVPLSLYVVKLLEKRKADNESDLGDSDHGFAFPTVDDNGVVRAIENIAEQRYVNGKKCRFIPGPQTLRRTFNTVATDNEKIPDAHRHILVDHAMPYAGVNAKHYYGRMSDDPIRESLERVTRFILEAAKVKDIDDAPDTRPSMRLVV